MLNSFLSCCWAVHWGNGLYWSESVRYVDSREAEGGGMEEKEGAAIGVRAKGESVDLGEILRTVLPILLRHLAESEERDCMR